MKTKSPKIWFCAVLLYLAIVALVKHAYPQEGPTVTVGQAPPNLAYTIVPFYSGTNLIYKCTALSNPKPATPSTGSISAATNANPVVLTSATHNFDPNALPIITISGGTGNWTPLNATFTATILSANTFSVPLDSTTFGALTGTITFTTQAPRLNQLIWSIQKFVYDGSNNMIGSYWAGDPTLTTATNSAMTKACSLRTTYSYQ